MEALLQGYDFDFFTLENNPSKESPEYFATLLDQYALEPEHIIYFDHQLPALESAQMVGIEQVFWSTELEKAKERLGDRLVT